MNNVQGFIKIDRSYTISIDSEIPYTPLHWDFNKTPLTIEFNIVRNTVGAPNQTSIRIYNLSLEHRNLIRFNQSDGGDVRFVTLAGGYNTNRPTICVGNINTCYSYRRGVDYITEIMFFDGGYAYQNSFSSLQFPANTSLKTVIGAMFVDLSKYNVQPGSIGASYSALSTRPNTYFGVTVDLLRELTNRGFFIDNGFANALSQQEVIDGTINLVNSSTGLLSTPVRQGTILSFDMIFEPGIVPGQQIQLVSATDQNFNGFYRVNTVKHHGMISPVVCGEVITSLEMNFNPLQVPIQRVVV